MFQFLIKKILVLFLVFVRDRFEIYELSTNIFRDEFDLHLSEVGCFNLDLAAGYCNNAVFWLSYSLSYLLTLAYINFHLYFTSQITT